MIKYVENLKPILIKIIFQNDVDDDDDYVIVTYRILKFNVFYSSKDFY